MAHVTEAPSILWVVLWFVPAMFVAVFVHELGHAVAGALTGHRVVACGVGTGAPLLRVRLFGVCFYIARRRMRVGLTFCIPPQLQPHRWRRIIMLAGGGAANALSALAMLGLLRIGIESPLVKTFLLTSLLGTANLLPFSITSPHYHLASDGMRILQCWRRLPDLTLPGHTLLTMTTLRDLSAKLDAWPGTIFCTLVLALVHLSLDDTETASRLLDSPCLQDPRRGEFARNLELFVRAELALDASAARADEAVRAFRASSPVDPMLDCLLHLSEAAAAHGRGEASGDLVRRAVAMARSAGWSSIEAMAESVLLRVEPPEDLWSACTELAKRSGARKLTLLTELRMFASAARMLAERGATVEARKALDAAEWRLHRIASSIAPDDLRARFVDERSKPLREVRELLPPLASPQTPIVPKSTGTVDVLIVRLLLGVLFVVAVAALASLATRPSPPPQPTRPISYAEARVSRLRRDVSSLRRLREQSQTSDPPERLIERIEGEVDDGVLAIASLEPTAAHAAVLREVYEYRMIWPRRTADPAHDRAVEEALSETASAAGSQDASSP